MEMGLEVFEELVERTLKGVGRELDGGTVVAEIDGHGLAFEGVGLAIEKGAGVLEDDGDELLFIAGDRLETFDLGPGDIAGGETAGIVGEAVVIDDEAGAVLYYPTDTA